MCKREVRVSISIVLHLLPALDLDFGFGLDVLGKLDLPEEVENAAAAAAVPYMDDSSGDE